MPTNRIIHPGGNGGGIVPPRSEILPIPLPPGVSFLSAGAAVCVVPPSPVSAKKNPSLTLLPRRDFKMILEAYSQAVEEHRPIVIYPEPDASPEGMRPKLERIEELDDDLAQLAARAEITVNGKRYDSLASGFRMLQPGEEIVIRREK